MSTATGNPELTRPDQQRSHGLPAAFALGICAVITQVVLAREGLSAAAGHELMFGIVLAGWLTGQALCLQLIWRPGRTVPVGLALMVAGLSAPVSLVLLRLALRSFTTADGTLPSLAAAVPLVLACTLPAGLGLSLAFAAVYHAAAARHGRSALRLVYAAETAGFLAGGTAWAFLLAGHISHLQAVLMLPAAMLAAGATLACRRRITWLAGAAAAVTMALVIDPPLRQALAPPLPEGLKAVATADGTHARWQVAEYGGEYSFYRNGRLTGTTGQPDHAAEQALLPLAQVLPAPDSALQDGLAVLHIGLRSPGLAERLNVIEGVAVTWLETDRDYTRLYEQYASDEEPGRIVRGSPAAALAMGPATGWDLVLLNTGPPSSPDTAWAYDRRFIARCSAALAPGGVLALSLDAEANYNSPARQELHRRISDSLQSVFPQLVISPPAPVWYFAGNSQAALNLDGGAIEQRLAGMGVNSPYMSSYVLADRLEPGRGPGWENNGGDGIPADGSARLAHAGLRIELSDSDPRLAGLLGWLIGARGWLGIVLAILVLGPALLLRPRQAAPGRLPIHPTAVAYLAGFTCLAGELALAWLLQEHCGQLYWLLALLTALVLGGLFLGTLLAGTANVPQRAAAGLLGACLGAVAALSAGGGFNSVGMPLLWVLAIVLPLLTGVILGQALGDDDAPPQSLYVADLAGAALAALLVGTIGLAVWGPAWCLAPLILAWGLAAAVPFRRRTVIMPR